MPWSKDLVTWLEMFMKPSMANLDNVKVPIKEVITHTRRFYRTQACLTLNRFGIHGVASRPSPPPGPSQAAQ